MIGKTVSHYHILTRVGGGGMGVVFEAEDTRLGRRVALKFLPDDLASDATALERFQREARTVAALNHPNICTIHDIDQHEGLPFIVMELMHGETLKQRLSRGALKSDELVELGSQLAEALEAAHAEGILHRDIKPANIFITERQQAKILDFGLAKAIPGKKSGSDIRLSQMATAADDQLTQAGATVGTIAYMSPEQARGEELDVRSDLFALGAVLYEMATGRLAFAGDTSAIVFDGILNRDPIAPGQVNPDMPGKLDEIIHKLMDKDRKLRYQNASDLKVDLRRLHRNIESGTTSAARPTASPDAPAIRRSNKGLALKILIPAAAVAVFAAAIFLARRPSDAPVSKSASADAPAAAGDVPATQPATAPVPVQSETAGTQPDARPATSQTPAAPAADLNSGTIDLPPPDIYSRGGRATRDNAAQAFNQRGQVAERERLSVTARYYDAQGDLPRAIEAYEAQKRAFPRDAFTYHRLGFLYFEKGQFEAAVTALEEAIRLRPGAAESHAVLANSLLALDRVDAAKAEYARAIELNIEPSAIHTALFAFAFFRGDTQAAERELGQMNAVTRLRGMGVTGKIAENRRGLGQRAGRMGQAGNEAAASRLFSSQALVEAVTGNQPQAQFGAQTALRLDRSSVEAALALAVIGQAEGPTVLQEILNDFPQGTLLNSLWIPTANASMEMRARNPAKAIELLNPARTYEAGPYGLMASYARGTAYLEMRSGREAASEFQKILNRPGVVAVSWPSMLILYPLSRLGLARSFAAAGDLPQARRSYQEFFAMWKDADGDIPILLQARQEFTNLGARGGSRNARGPR